MKQIKTYRYKLKPTKDQAQQLEQWLGVCRYIYNLTLDYKLTLWNHYKISVKLNDVQWELTRIAQETEWMKALPAHVRQDATNRVFIAFDKFFKEKKGFPRFARKNRYNSLTFPTHIKVNPDESVIQLPKIGLVKYHNHRPLKGTLKKITVIKEVNGWYASLTVAEDIDYLPRIKTGIGIDFGIRSVIIASNGEKAENPKYTYQYEKKLAKLSRAVSRKKKGSSNQAKAAKKVARLQNRISNSRLDYQHKLSTKLIRENQTIALEDIRVNNFSSNRYLYKALKDAAWGQLIRLIEYKAHWYGRTVIKVAPYNTSKTCSNCGHLNKEVHKAKYIWVCSACGATHDRDINAAVNIKNKAVGRTVSA